MIVDASGERVARLKRLRVRGKTATLESLNAKYKPSRAPAKSVEAFEIAAHLPRVREITTG